MTAVEAYELTTQGGTTDFARVIEVCQSAGEYCLIGGLAVNCYVEPVYTLDADIVVVAAPFSDIQGRKSNLRIQFTTDPRYQAFLQRARDSDVLGARVKVACLEDVTQGKLWAYADPQRRLSKRKKDELDLIRLAEAFPDLKARYPSNLVEEIDKSSSGADH